MMRIRRLRLLVVPRFPLHYDCGEVLRGDGVQWMEDRVGRELQWFDE